MGELVAGLGVALMLPPLAPALAPTFVGFCVPLLARLVALPAAFAGLGAPFEELAALPPPAGGDCGFIPENAYQKQNTLTMTRPTQMKARFTKTSRCLGWFPAEYRAPLNLKE